MAQATTTVIKDTPSKDNNDSKHQKNLTTGSAATCSKAKAKNVEFSPPPPPFPPLGQKKNQLAKVASPFPPKPTVNASLVTPKKLPIDVDREDSDTFTSKSLNGSNDGGISGDHGMGVCVTNVSSIVLKSGSNSTEEAATAGVALTSNLSTEDNVTGETVWMSVFRKDPQSC